MSITAARVFLASTLGAMVVCAIWAGIAWHVAGRFSPSSGLAVALTLVPAVLLVSGLLFFPRFVEARVSGDELVIRRVFGRRVVDVVAVREVLILAGLVLPSRVSGPLVRRVVLRGESGVIDAFSAPDDQVVDALRSRGVPIIAIEEALSAAQARRRVAGSMSAAEVLLGPALPVIVVGALGVAAALVLV